MEPITVEQGKVVQQRFNAYQVLQISEMTKTDVGIVPSGETPGRVRET